MCIFVLCVARFSSLGVDCDDRYLELQRVSWVKALEFHVSHMPFEIVGNQVELQLGDEAGSQEIELFTDSPRGENDFRISVTCLLHFA